MNKNTGKSKTGPRLYSTDKVLDFFKKNKPSFFNFINSHKNTKIADYYRKTLILSKNTENEKYKIALKFIALEAKKRLGETASSDLVSDLKKYNIIGTADHHGILSSPFFVHNVLIESLIREELKLKTVPVLSCGNIPVDNSSYPRGIIFTDKYQNNYKKIPLLSLKHKKIPVYLQRGFSLADYNKFKKIFEGNSLRNESSDIILKIIKGEIGKKNYTTQITKINYALHKHLFKNLKLIYLDQETIVLDLISKYHIPQNTIIKSLLFNEEVIKEYIKHFDGIQGAFDSKKNKGSILFWYIENNKKISVVDFKNGSFILENGNKIKINSELKKELKNKKIVPTMALCYIVLSFYHQVECAGGFSQIGYLPEMHRAFNAMSKKFAWDLSSKNLDNLYRGDIVIAEIEMGDQVWPATLIDILNIKNQKGLFFDLKNKIKTMTMKDGIIPISKQLYEEVTGERSLAKKNTLFTKTYKIK